MHRKSIMRNLFATSLVFLLVITGITVLVLAASGDSEATLQTSFPAVGIMEPSVDSAEAASVATPATLALEPTENPAAEICFVHMDEVIPFETIYTQDNTLKKGTQVVQAEGSEGLQRYTEEIVMHNGIEVARQSVGLTVLKEPETRVVLQGTYDGPKKLAAFPSATSTKPVSATGSTPTTPSYGVTTYSTKAGGGTYDETQNMLASVTIDKVNQTITLPSGEVLSFTKSFIGEATGYSCNNDPNAKTYSGTKARVGEVAVDPRFIPLGTKMFIMLSDGSLIYGTCVAEDTGSAVKGNIIDLYMNTLADCSLIGRSACDVYILS